MAELLIVIALIILLIAIAIPAFSFITGSKSIDGAVNQISAFLGRARNEAIGLQETRGVMFFIDPTNERVNLAMVHETPRRPATDNANVAFYLDVVEDSEFLPLPPGIGLQVVDDCAYVGGKRADDGYIGFNRGFAPNPNSASNQTVSPYGGVILFDGNGQLISRTYAFRVRTPSPTSPGNDVYTRMAELLWPVAPGNANPHKAGDAVFGTVNDVIPTTPANLALWMHSQFGLVLFDRQAFTNMGFTRDDPQIMNTAYANNAEQTGEEPWLDDNASPVLVNRYNGTVIRGE